MTEAVSYCIGRTQCSYSQTSLKMEIKKKKKDCVLFQGQIRGIQVPLRQETQFCLLLLEPKETTRPQCSEMR